MLLQNAVLVSINYVEHQFLSRTIDAVAWPILCLDQQRIQLRPVRM